MKIRIGRLVAINFFVGSLALTPAGADEIPATLDSKKELSGREREIERLSTMTITADPFNPSLLDYGKPVSFLEAEQIKPLAEMSLGETLQLQPGVSSSFAGPASSRPVIRGFAGERVRILRNGVGSLDVSNTSEDHAVTVNPLAIDTVEILRGPETLLYGSSAIGGVVNTTDQSIPEYEIGTPLTGAFDLRSRTNDDELSGALKLQGQQGAFNWHLDAFHADSSNYEIPGNVESRRLIELEESEAHSEHEHEEAHGHEDGDHSSQRGILANSFASVKGFTVGTSYIKDNGFFGISFNGFKSRYGVPVHAHGDEEHEDDHASHDHEDEDHETEHHNEEHEGHHHEHADHHDDIHDRSLTTAMSSLVGDHHFDSDEMGHVHSTTNDAGAVIDLTQYRIDTKGKLKNPTKGIKDAKMRVSLSNYDHSESEGGEVATRYSNDAVEGRFEAKHEEFYGLTGTFGFQGEYSDFGAEGEEAFIPSSKRYSPALFLYESLPLADRLKFMFGSRTEYVAIDPEFNDSQDFVPVSFSGGFLYDPLGDSSYTLSLTSAYTERAPSASELFANGSHFARQIFEIGDTSLGKEKSYGVDLALKKNTGIVTGGLSLFAQRYEDYINLSGSGDSEDGFPVFEYNNIPALFTGVEFEQTFHLHEVLGLYAHEFDLSAQVDYVRARNTKDYSDIPRIPPLRGILRARYGYKDWLSAMVEGVFADSQNKVAESELVTDSYQIMNAQVDLHLPYFDRYVSSFYVRGTNLTDEEVRLSTSFIKDFAPLRGRAVLFGLRTLF